MDESEPLVSDFTELNRNVSFADQLTGKKSYSALDNLDDEDDINANIKTSSIWKPGEKRPFLVEIPFFFYMFAIWSSLPLNEQYVYAVVYGQLTGKESSLDDEGCASGNKTSEELQIGSYVKSVVSNWVLVFNLLETGPAIFVALILCSYGDKYGRRLGLLLPALGGVLKIIGYILVDIFKLDVGILCIPNLIEGLSGSHMTVAGAAYAYIADVVPLSSRTFRFAILNSILFAASAVGNILLGLTVSLIGFSYSFSILGMSYLIAALYVIFLLPESVNVSEKSVDKRDDKGSLEVVKEAFKSTMAAFKIYTKPRKDPRIRVRLFLMLTASTLHAILVLGQVELDTLYLLGYPFCFNALLIGVFLAALCTGSVIGPICGTKLFQFCGLSDALMGIIAGLSGFVAFLVQAFAQNTLTIFMVPILNFYSAAISPLARSIMSKDVLDSEQGALQASVSSLNTLGDLVSVTLLIGLYSLTVYVFNGAVFVAISLLCVIIFIFFALVATVYKVDYDEPNFNEAPSMMFGERVIE